MDLVQQASLHQRSLEGEIRFGLSAYVQSLSKTAPAAPTLRERWQRETGRRISQLVQQLAADGVFAWNHSDIPHLALELGELSPALLMDCIEGHEPLPFDLARRIAGRFSCNLSWLISGKQSMFCYPEIGSTYEQFFEPALADSSHTIKMVRLCGGKHDATLLLFRIEEKSPHIAAGYCATQFNLGGSMGGTGNAKYAGFARYLADQGGMRWDAYNFMSHPDDGSPEDHHPSFYLNLARLDRAHWKQPLMQGLAPEKIEWVAVQ
jgi:hypothetical protein